MSIIHLVSMSGGKDSTATALLARELHGAENVRYVFADTGNEHEIVYDYLLYLESALDIEIVRLKRDFSVEWERRRNYVRDVWPTKLVEKSGYSVDQAQETVARALVILDAGPTGNPYLDLCIIKGRFPGRKSQFCTQFLKTEPLTEYAMGLIDAGHVVWSWQGVRSEESPGRARAAEFEEVGGALFIIRPIKRWLATDVFDAHRVCGIKPNPLYTMGMSRVGCMPCINANKGEIAEIARRFPAEMERIAEWESIVGRAGKRDGHSSFFPAPDAGGRGAHQGKNITEIIRWAGTTRGGKQFDLLRPAEDVESCSSSYGLCE